ncbi:MAG: hypothetical protein Q7R50_01560 [Dehalococcoidales bacterium]|nr:hypothetical protein [Dehalococcoidales bacterium]
MKCSRCGRELTEDKAYNYQGKVMCEDCLMDVGLNPHNCDPWATYVDTAARKRHGVTGAAGLTEPEKRVYDFIKSKGRATRQEVMEGLAFTEQELRDRLIGLLHNELVKEASEGGKQFLVIIG